MRLSVVTPVWNDPRVSDAVRSVRAQHNAGDVEVIVVDGGSGKATQQALLDVASEIDQLVSEPDKGIYDAMNKGIRMATGDAVGILNADDRFGDLSFLSSVRKEFAAGAQATYSDIVVERRDGSVKRRWRAGKPGPLKWRLGWMPPHPGMFVHRDVYAQHGMYDLDYGLSADYEFMVRVLYRRHVALSYVPVCAVRMAEGGQTHTTLSYIRRGWRDAKRIWNDHKLYGGLLAATAKPLRKVGQWRPAFASRNRSVPDPAEGDT